MNLTASMAPRTLISAIRTSLYGGLGTFLAVSNAEAQSIVEALVVGGVMADLITWFVMTVIYLPDNLVHGFYEGLINLFFVLLLLHFGYSGSALALDAQSMALAFLAFMLVLLVKVIWYGAAYIAEIVEG